MDATELLANSMATSMPNEGETQAEFIKNEMNFDVNPDDPLTKAALSDHPVDEWMDILGNGQLQKKVIKPGENNSRPNRTDLCVLKLVGKLEDGSIVEEFEELEIQLGDVEIIQGLDLAVALMDVGEEAEVKVHSRFAYGDLGRTKDPKFPDIPPKSTIIYTVTLKSVELEPDIDKLNTNKKRELGHKKRERGNWWFARDEPTIAIQCYRRALDFLNPSSDADIKEEKDDDKVSSPTDADLQALLEDTLKVHNNLAAAQLKTQAYDAALNSVETVLTYQPQNVKALFRKGKILHHKGEHAKACVTLANALKIEPDNKAIQQELFVLKKKSAKDALHEKNLYRKMLGEKNRNINNTNSIIKKGNKKITSFTWILGGTAIATAIAGLVAYRIIA